MVSLCVEDYRRILHNNETKITNSTNLKCLLPILQTKGLLTDAEFQLLHDMPSYEAHRSSQLVSILLKKGGGNALNLFVEALQEEYEHLGHKTLAVSLLGELTSIKTKTAKKPAPPVPLQKPSKVSHTHASQTFSTPQPVRKQLRTHKSRSLSVTEVDAEKMFSQVAISYI